jgi:predicted anti-sigma-YlaC factor YlaD
MCVRDGAVQPLPSDVDCHVVVKVLQFCLDGDVGPQDAELIAAHLEHCGRCQIQSATVERS